MTCALHQAGYSPGDTAGLTGFDVSVWTVHPQRVVAYHAEPRRGIPNANDEIASEAAHGIGELEDMLAAESALVAA